MTAMPVAMLALLAIGAGLALLKVARPATATERTVAVALYASLAAACLVTLAVVTGVPRDTRLETITRLAGGSGAAEADVLGIKVVPDVSIMIWVWTDGEDEPVAYRAPWDKQLAEAAQEAERLLREGKGGGVRMRLPFEPTLDPREPKFYELPQPALPPKDRTAPPPVEVPSIDA